MDRFGDIRDLANFNRIQNAIYYIVNSVIEEYAEADTNSEEFLEAADDSIRDRKVALDALKNFLQGQHTGVLINDLNQLTNRENLETLAKELIKLFSDPSDAGDVLLQITEGSRSGVTSLQQLTKFMEIFARERIVGLFEERDPRDSNQYLIGRDFLRDSHSGVNQVSRLGSPRLFNQTTDDDRIGFQRDLLRGTYSSGVITGNQVGRAMLGSILDAKKSIQIGMFQMESGLILDALSMQQQRGVNVNLTLSPYQIKDKAGEDRAVEVGYWNVVARNLLGDTSVRFDKDVLDRKADYAHYKIVGVDLESDDLKERKFLIGSFNMTRGALGQIIDRNGRLVKNAPHNFELGQLIDYSLVQKHGLKEESFIRMTTEAQDYFNWLTNRTNSRFKPLGYNPEHILTGPQTYERLRQSLGINSSSRVNAFLALNVITDKGMLELRSESGEKKGLFHDIEHKLRNSADSKITIFVSHGFEGIRSVNLNADPNEDFRKTKVFQLMQQLKRDFGDRFNFIEVNQYIHAKSAIIYQEGGQIDRILGTPNVSEAGFGGSALDVSLFDSTTHYNSPEYVDEQSRNVLSYLQSIAVMPFLRKSITPRSNASTQRILHELKLRSTTNLLNNVKLSPIRKFNANNELVDIGTKVSLSVSVRGKNNQIFTFNDILSFDVLEYNESPDRLYIPQLHKILDPVIAINPRQAVKRGPNDFGRGELLALEIDSSGYLVAGIDYLLTNIHELGNSVLDNNFIRQSGRRQFELSYKRAFREAFLKTFEHAEGLPLGQESPARRFKRQILGLTLAELSAHATPELRAIARAFNGGNVPEGKLLAPRLDLGIIPLLSPESMEAGFLLNILEDEHTVRGTAPSHILRRNVSFDNDRYVENPTIDKLMYTLLAQSLRHDGPSNIFLAEGFNYLPAFNYDQETSGVSQFASPVKIDQLAQRINNMLGIDSGVVRMSGGALSHMKKTQLYLTKNNTSIGDRTQYGNQFNILLVEGLGEATFLNSDVFRGADIVRPVTEEVKVQGFQLDLRSDQGISFFDGRLRKTQEGFWERWNQETRGYERVTSGPLITFDSSEKHISIMGAYSYNERQNMTMRNPVFGKLGHQVQVTGIEAIRESGGKLSFNVTYDILMPVQGSTRILASGLKMVTTGVRGDFFDRLANNMQGFANKLGDAQLFYLNRDGAVAAESELLGTAREFHEGTLRMFHSSREDYQTTSAPRSLSGSMVHIAAGESLVKTGVAFLSTALVRLNSDARFYNRFEAIFKDEAKYKQLQKLMFDFAEASKNLKDSPAFVRRKALFQGIDELLNIGTSSGRGLIDSLSDSRKTYLTALQGIASKYQQGLSIDSLHEKVVLSAAATLHVMEALAVSRMSKEDIFSMSMEMSNTSTYKPAGKNQPMQFDFGAIIPISLLDAFSLKAVSLSDRDTALIPTTMPGDHSELVVQALSRNELSRKRRKNVVELFSLGYIGSTGENARKAALGRNINNVFYDANNRPNIINAAMNFEPLAYAFNNMSRESENQLVRLSSIVKDLSFGTHDESKISELRSEALSLVAQYKAERQLAYDADLPNRPGRPNLSSRSQLSESDLKIYELMKQAKVQSPTILINLFEFNELSNGNYLLRSDSIGPISTEVVSLLSPHAITNLQGVFDDFKSHLFQLQTKLIKNSYIVKKVLKEQNRFGMVSAETREEYLDYINTVYQFKDEMKKAAASDIQKSMSNVVGGFAAIANFVPGYHNIQLGENELVTLENSIVVGDEVMQKIVERTRGVLDLLDNLNKNFIRKTNGHVGTHARSFNNRTYETARTVAKRSDFVQNLSFYGRNRSAEGSNIHTISHNARGWIAISSRYTSNLDSVNRRLNKLISVISTDEPITEEMNAEYRELLVLKDKLENREEASRLSSANSKQFVITNRSRRSALDAGKKLRSVAGSIGQNNLTIEEELLTSRYNSEGVVSEKGSIGSILRSFTQIDKKPIKFINKNYEVKKALQIVFDVEELYETGFRSKGQNNVNKNSFSIGEEADLRETYKNKEGINRLRSKVERNNSIVLSDNKYPSFRLVDLVRQRNAIFEDAKNQFGLTRNPGERHELEEMLNDISSKNSKEQFGLLGEHTIAGQELQVAHTLSPPSNMSREELLEDKPLVDLAIQLREVNQQIREIARVKKSIQNRIKGLKDQDILDRRTIKLLEIIDAKLELDFRTAMQIDRPKKSEKIKEKITQLEGGEFEQGGVTKGSIDVKTLEIEKLFEEIQKDHRSMVVRRAGALAEARNKRLETEAIKEEQRQKRNVRKLLNSRLRNAINLERKELKRKLLAGDTEFQNNIKERKRLTLELKTLDADTIQTELSHMGVGITDEGSLVVPEHGLSIEYQANIKKLEILKQKSKGYLGFNFLGYEDRAELKRLEIFFRENTLDQVQQSHDFFKKRVSSLLSRYERIGNIHNRLAELGTSITNRSNEVYEEVRNQYVRKVVKTRNVSVAGVGSLSSKKGKVFKISLDNNDTIRNLWERENLIEDKLESIKVKPKGLVDVDGVQKNVSDKLEGKKFGQSVDIETFDGRLSSRDAGILRITDRYRLRKEAKKAGFVILNTKEQERLLHLNNLVDSSNFVPFNTAVHEEFLQLKGRDEKEQELRQQIRLRAARLVTLVDERNKLRLELQQNKKDYAEAYEEEQEQKRKDQIVTDRFNQLVERDPANRRTRVVHSIMREYTEEKAYNRNIEARQKQIYLLQLRKHTLEKQVYGKPTLYKSEHGKVLIDEVARINSKLSNMAEEDKFLRLSTVDEFTSFIASIDGQLASTNSRSEVKRLKHLKTQALRNIEEIQTIGNGRFVKQASSSQLNFGVSVEDIKYALGAGGVDVNSLVNHIESQNSLSTSQDAFEFVRSLNGVLGVGSVTRALQQAAQIRKNAAVGIVRAGVPESSVGGVRAFNVHSIRRFNSLLEKVGLTPILDEHMNRRSMFMHISGMAVGLGDFDGDNVIVSVMTRYTLLEQLHQTYGDEGLGKVERAAKDIISQLEKEMQKDPSLQGKNQKIIDQYRELTSTARHRGKDISLLEERKLLKSALTDSAQEVIVENVEAFMGLKKGGVGDIASKIFGDEYNSATEKRKQELRQGISVNFNRFAWDLFSVTENKTKKFMMSFISKKGMNPTDLHEVSTDTFEEMFRDSGFRAEAEKWLAKDSEILTAYSKIGQGIGKVFGSFVGGEVTADDIFRYGIKVSFAANKLIGNWSNTQMMLQTLDTYRTMATYTDIVQGAKEFQDIYSNGDISDEMKKELDELARKNAEELKDTTSERHIRVSGMYNRMQQEVRDAIKLKDPDATDTKVDSILHGMYAGSKLIQAIDSAIALVHGKSLFSGISYEFNSGTDKIGNLIGLDIENMFIENGDGTIELNETLIDSHERYKQIRHELIEPMLEASSTSQTAIKALQENLPTEQALQLKEELTDITQQFRQTGMMAARSVLTNAQDAQSILEYKKHIVKESADDFNAEKVNLERHLKLVFLHQQMKGGKLTPQVMERALTDALDSYFSEGDLEQLENDSRNIDPTGHFHRNVLDAMGAYTSGKSGIEIFQSLRGRHISAYQTINDIHTAMHEINGNPLNEVNTKMQNKAKVILDRSLSLSKERAVTHANSVFHNGLMLVPFIIGGVFAAAGDAQATQMETGTRDEGTDNSAEKIGDMLVGMFTTWKPELILNQVAHMANVDNKTKIAYATSFVATLGLAHLGSSYAQRFMPRAIPSANIGESIQKASSVLSTAFMAVGGHAINKLTEAFLSRDMRRLESRLPESYQAEGAIVDSIVYAATEEENMDVENNDDFVELSQDENQDPIPTGVEVTRSELSNMTDEDSNPIMAEVIEVNQEGFGIPQVFKNPTDGKISPRKENIERAAKAAKQFLLE